MEYHHIICKKCGVTLRVPKNIGRLAISCPKCRYQFEFHSGPKQASASHVRYGNVGFWPNPNPVSRSHTHDTTFNIIKDDSIANQYFQSVALMSRAGLHCTGITLKKECPLYVEKIWLSAEIQGLGTILSALTGRLTRENNRIEQEYRRKTSGYNAATEDTRQIFVRVSNEAREERKRVQDIVDIEFFKSILGQADTASNRELIGSPFHCFWSSGGEIILDEDFWVVAPGRVGLRKVMTHFVPKDLKHMGYKSKRVIPAMKMLAAQYGLNVPITEVSQ